MANLSTLTPKELLDAIASDPNDNALWAEWYWMNFCECSKEGYFMWLYLFQYELYSSEEKK